jgi:hypothetical protein
MRLKADPTSLATGARRVVASSVTAIALLAGTNELTWGQAPPAGESQPAAGADSESSGGGAITWTGLPKVDLENPALHRGVVLGPDGAPLAGASVYAASTIELMEMADEDEVSVDDLGPVRAVTDAEGRFQFAAKDLTWATASGERKRWEALLLATKEGLPPGWLRTWGADRSLRESWHPGQEREVVVRLRSPANLSGRLLLEGGAPLKGARVRLTSLMAPVEYDLNVHIPKEEVNPVGLFQTIDYAEAIYRPQVLPGLARSATTDDDGRFELAGLPEGFIAGLEFTHPDAMTTGLRAAVRPIEPVFRKLEVEGEKPTPTLYGSGFTLDLAKGAVLSGQAFSTSSPDRKAAGGVTIALANHNAADGMWGQRFTADADGRFKLTGLPIRPEGFEVAFVGSFAAPFAARRQRIVPGEDAQVALEPAAPYRLKLVDPEGNPVDREVASIEVQTIPGTVRHTVKTDFNTPVKVAPGVYEGIVPIGPGAVLVKRGAKADRPAFVQPKDFFAPGRTDWTLDERRYAFGDEWRIARPAVVTTEALSVGRNPTADQLELAAVVLTNVQVNDRVHELTATVHSDPPVEVLLVDEAGLPVGGAQVARQLKRYDGEDLPPINRIYGLHPQRAEFLVFTHGERGLIGALSTTWTPEPITVVMRPAATLIGRITDKFGQKNHDFSIRVFGQGVMPETQVGGRLFNPTKEPGERPGEFKLVVPPGDEVRGEFVRRAADQETRPSAGQAFGPVVPKPGETIQLGDLVVP